MAQQRISRREEDEQRRLREQLRLLRGLRAPWYLEAQLQQRLSGRLERRGGRRSIRKALLYGAAGIVLLAAAVTYNEFSQRADQAGTTPRVQDVPFLEKPLQVVATPDSAEKRNVTSPPVLLPAVKARILTTPRVAVPEAVSRALRDTAVRLDLEATRGGSRPLLDTNMRREVVDSSLRSADTAGVHAHDGPAASRKDSVTVREDTSKPARGERR